MIKKSHFDRYKIGFGPSKLPLLSSRQRAAECWNQALASLFHKTCVRCGRQWLWKYLQTQFMLFVCAG